VYAGAPSNAPPSVPLPVSEPASTPPELVVEPLDVLEELVPVEPLDVLEVVEPLLDVLELVLEVVSPDELDERSKSLSSVEEQEARSSKAATTVRIIHDLRSREFSQQTLPIVARFARLGLSAWAKTWPLRIFFANA
jgi:hypothetical protein